MNTVRVVDRGANALLRRLAKSREVVRVGILDDSPKKAREGDGGRYNLEVAAVHEFGAPAAGIPQRSFIRATVDLNAGEIARLQHATMTAYVQGKVTLRQGLDRIGMKVAAMMQKRIAAGIDPPLSPATVAKKKSSTPLVDTGQLRSAVTWLVEGT
jgi:phage gpG-like protein